METPNILDVIRMYRKERDWTFEKACDEAVRMFNEKGWPMPDWFRREAKESRDFKWQDRRQTD